MQFEQRKCADNEGRMGWVKLIQAETAHSGGLFATFEQQDSMSSHTLLHVKACLAGAAGWSMLDLLSGGSKAYGSPDCFLSCDLSSK